MHTENTTQSNINYCPITLTPITQCNKEKPHNANDKEILSDIMQKLSKLDYLTRLQAI